MLISEEQINAYVSNLKGRLNYETKKAAKLGYSTIQDYVKDKLSGEIEQLQLKLCATPSAKRAKSKSAKKKKAVQASSCGCCS
tara:strand:- start:144 stop:392 length:249 start_codon:yes stop_codon:yes gene_type:complete